MQEKKATIYLIPVPLAEVELSTSLPEYNHKILKTIKHFIVENIRSARRFIKSVDRSIDIDSLRFYELNKHSDPKEIASYLDVAVKNGEDMGIISEAGVPAVADPGAEIVAIAQRKELNVVPLVGPSSILLSLMASGSNGQSFRFVGYLPIDDSKRAQTLKQLESLALRGETQIFIETPYRNNRLLQDIIKNLKGSTIISVSSNLTSENAKSISRPVSWWQKNKIELEKVPSIFLICS